jgi:hypothetical protein
MASLPVTSSAKTTLLRCRPFHISLTHIVSQRFSDRADANWWFCSYWFALFLWYRQWEWNEWSSKPLLLLRVYSPTFPNSPVLLAVWFMLVFGLAYFQLSGRIYIYIYSSDISIEFQPATRCYIEKTSYIHFKSCVLSTEPRSDAISN